MCRIGALDVDDDGSVGICVSVRVSGGVSVGVLGCDGVWGLVCVFTCVCTRAEMNGSNIYMVRRVNSLRR